MKKLVLLALVSGSAFAQEVPSETVEVKFKERTEIIFDGVKLDGQHVGPNNTLIAEPPRAAEFPPLIELRKDFSHEMRRSVDAIK